MSGSLTTWLYGRYVEIQWGLIQLDQTEKVARKVRRGRFTALFFIFRFWLIMNFQYTFCINTWCIFGLS